MVVNTTCPQCHKDTAHGLHLAALQTPITVTIHEPPGLKNNINIWWQCILMEQWGINDNPRYQDDPCLPPAAFWSVITFQSYVNGKEKGQKYDPSHQRHSTVSSPYPYFCSLVNSPSRWQQSQDLRIHVIKPEQHAQNLTYTTLIWDKGNWKIWVESRA